MCCCLQKTEHCCPRSRNAFFQKRWPISSVAACAVIDLLAQVMYYRPTRAYSCRKHSTPGPYNQLDRLYRCLYRHCIPFQWLHHMRVQSNPDYTRNDIYCIDWCFSRTHHWNCNYLDSYLKKKEERITLSNLN